MKLWVTWIPKLQMQFVDWGKKVFDEKSVNKLLDTLNGSHIYVTHIYTLKWSGIIIDMREGNVAFKKLKT